MSGPAKGAFSLVQLLAQPGAYSPPSASRTWEAGRELAAPVMRSVSLPFTAPALTAMRVRASPSGSLEMLLSNPAGGRGIYVAGWAMLRTFATPSLHDILLAERVIAGQHTPDSLSPASIRLAALAVAQEGHAGRRVAQAAGRAITAEAFGVKRLRAHLLLELAKALGFHGSEFTLKDPWTTQPDGHRSWLAEAPPLLADRLNLTCPRRRPTDPAPWSSSSLADAIRRISAVAWPLGVGPEAAQARLPRVLRLLSTTIWPNEQRLRDEHGRGIGNLETAIDARVAQVEAALNDNRDLLVDPLGLLAAWRADEAVLLQALEQPDWMLDGWDRLCLLPSETGEMSALAQMLLYGDDQRISLSRSEAEWIGQPGLNDSTTLLDRLTRNESMRLRELRLHDPDCARGRSSDRSGHHG